jgi:hypothetical protein
MINVKIKNYNFNSILFYFINQFLELSRNKSLD